MYDLKGTHNEMEIWLMDVVNEKEETEWTTFGEKLMQ